MVFLSNTIFANVRKKLRKYLRTGFRDSLRVFVSGGAGGNGLPKFGGVGGNGGDVIAVAKQNLTLAEVYQQNTSKRYLAQNGRHSTHNFILGVPGSNVTVEVPVGVTIYTDYGKCLGELNEDGKQLVVAKGGTGGHPKNGFLGKKGEAYAIKLDLKLIADIGLVGFPNAGKSTLLKAISSAKPKIASYPFTTVRPNIGILTYKDLRQISMADLPGLIEGAHANKGMGHEFLKHVERTKLLLMIVDVNGFQLSPMHPHRNCLETVMLLIKELEMYNAELLTKPSMLLVNKMDTEGAFEKYNSFKECIQNFPEAREQVPEEMRPTNLLKFNDVIPMSARDKDDDVNYVKQRLRNLLDIISEFEQWKENESGVYEKVKQKVSESGLILV